MSIANYINLVLRHYITLHFRIADIELRHMVICGHEYAFPHYQNLPFITIPKYGIFLKFLIIYRVILATFSASKKLWETTMHCKEIIMFVEVRLTKEDSEGNKNETKLFDNRNKELNKGTNLKHNQK